VLKKECVDEKRKERKQKGEEEARPFMLSQDVTEFK
jgi:hypothetical protein